MKVSGPVEWAQGSFLKEYSVVYIKRLVANSKNTGPGPRIKTILI